MRTRRSLTPELAGDMGCVATPPPEASIMRPRGWVAGSPIFEAMTENRDVMRAMVFEWNVARSSRDKGVSGVGLGAEAGKCKEVDSVDETSRMRMFVFAWSSV